MSSNKNLREVSLKILTNVLLKEKKLKDEFDYFSKQIDKKNVNFLKNLVYGVLRFKESIDEKIKEYYKKSFDKLNEKSKNILRIALYQIDIMDSIPNYASVNTAVEIAKCESVVFSKVVNAILMNFIRNSDKLDFSKYNHSEKIINEWKKEYSNQQIKDLCNWNNSTPKIWFRSNDKFLNTIKLDDKNKFQHHSEITNYITFDNSKLAIEKYVKKKLLIVQSPSSSLVCKILDVKENDTVIDCCAST